MPIKSEYEELKKLNVSFQRLNATLDHFKDILDKQMAEQDKSREAYEEQRKKQEHYISQDHVLNILRCNCGAYFYTEVGPEKLVVVTDDTRKQALYHLIQVGEVAGGVITKLSEFRKWLEAHINDNPNLERKGAFIDALREFDRQMNGILKVV